MESFENNIEFAKFQNGMKEYFEYRKNAPVQAFINSMSLPDSIEDLLYYMKLRDRLLDPEQLIIYSKAKWSVPRWCKRDDIVLFMVTVTSSQAISRVRAEIKKKKGQLSPEDYKLLKFGLMREESLYNYIGGSIFAIGKVAGPIEKFPDDTRVYADVDNITILEEPIRYDEFKSKIPVTRAGSITPVYSDKFSALKSKLSKRNDLPLYVLKSRSEPIREHFINRSNWLGIAKYYRFHYTLEEQFRKAFVDYLLKDISDSRKIYSECYCRKDDGQFGYIDNVVLFNGKYLPIEVKLNVDLEINLIGQVSKYCSLSILKLDGSQTLDQPKEKVYSDKVIIIDTYGIYIYDDNSRNYSKIYDFFNLSSKEDLQRIKELIADSLNSTKNQQNKYYQYKNMYVNMLSTEVTGVNDFLEDYENTPDNRPEYSSSMYREKMIQQSSLNNFEQYLVTKLEPEEALEYVNQFGKEQLIDNSNESDLVL